MTTALDLAWVSPTGQFRSAMTDAVQRRMGMCVCTACNAMFTPAATLGQWQCATRRGCDHRASRRVHDDDDETYALHMPAPVFEAMRAAFDSATPLLRTYDARRDASLLCYVERTHYVYYASRADVAHRLRRLRVTVGDVEHTFDAVAAYNQCADRYGYARFDETTWHAVARYRGDQTRSELDALVGTSATTAADVMLYGQPVDEAQRCAADVFVPLVLVFCERPSSIEAIK